MRFIFLVVFSLTATCCAAQIQFVGMMARSSQMLFALREGSSVTAKWVSIGDHVGGFVVHSYESRTESLTLKKGEQYVVLRLPESRVQMARDEVFTGLQKILNVRSAGRVFELLHPKLRPMFKEADFDSIVFADVLAPGTKLEIREIPEDFSRALERSLSDVEKVVGSRPTSGLWIIKANGCFSMTFVLASGDSWFLAPGVPDKQ